jgi:hypothetical protein
MNIKLQGESARVLASVAELTNSAPAKIVSKLLLDKYRVEQDNKFSLLLDLSPTKKSQLTFCADELEVSLCKVILMALDEFHTDLIGKNH